MRTPEETKIEAFVPFCKAVEQLAGHYGLDFESVIELLCRWEMAGQVSSDPIWEARYYNRDFSWFPQYLNQHRATPSYL